MKVYFLVNTTLKCDSLKLYYGTAVYQAKPHILLQWKCWCLDSIIFTMFAIVVDSFSMLIFLTSTHYSKLLSQKPKYCKNQKSEQCTRNRDYSNSGEMNVCTKFHGNPSCRGCDISLKTSPWSWLDSSSGNHEQTHFCAKQVEENGKWRPKWLDLILRGAQIHVKHVMLIQSQLWRYFTEKLKSKLLEVCVWCEH